MEHEKEIGTFITDMQQAQQALSKRVDKAEEQQKKEAEEYSRLAKEYRETFQTHAENIEIMSKEQERLKQQVNGFAEVSGKLNKSLERVEEMIKRGNGVISAFPEKMKTELELRFDSRLKAVVIIIAVSIIVTAISLSLFLRTHAENVRLQSNDLKFRYLQLDRPSEALHIDTLYSRAPENFRKTIQYREAQKRAINMAEITAREKTKEAIKAAEEVKRLHQLDARKSNK